MITTSFTTKDMVASSIVSALRYYQVFKYPLKAEEIYGNMPTRCSLACLLVALDDMNELDQIYRYEGYYSLDQNVKEQVLRRITANELAVKKMSMAVKVGKFINMFPFVRFTGISGSLSKGYADSKSDFDYFIVTDKNRLWVCRSLLHLFKKLTFLAGQQHKFCMNYFIDEHNLVIQEQNRFTAVELSSLVPVSGYETYIRLEKANTWVLDYFPNGYIGFTNGIDSIDDRKGNIKKLLESIFECLSPERLNVWLMKLTDRKWRKKWKRKNYPMEDYDLAFKTTLHVSKNHHRNHQKKVLNIISKLDD